MDAIVAASDTAFWTRAKRHMLRYGGEFVPFVPVRAEGAFSTTRGAAACSISPRAR